MTRLADARARLYEQMAVDEAQAKLRAMTGADQAQIDQLTAQAQRLADSHGGPLSAALEVVAEQLAYPKPPDPLASLRAEVEAERADAERAFTADRTDASAMVAQFCFALVLDLIDKHLARPA